MKRISYLMFLVFVFFYISGCSDSSNNPVKCTNDLPALLAPLYDCAPRINDCYEGTIKTGEKTKVLNRLNTIRALHNLSQLTYNIDDDIYVQKSALITCSNEVMNHHPDSTATCYSAQGYKGCSEGNIWLGYANSVHAWQSENMINDWIIDTDVATLGHRRWLLNPFLTTIAFGRVDKIKSDGYHWTASTIKVIPTSGSFGAITTNIDYIAYPQGNYPASAFQLDWYLSFSVLADKSQWSLNNKVDYSAATIEITDNNSLAMTINSIAYDNDGYGLPNNIQWKVVGLQADIKYNVKIKNVKVKGVAKDYEYWFTINSIA